MRTGPLRVQTRPGSVAANYYRQRSGLPGTQFNSPKALARGASRAPLSDLLFHGGKTLPQCEYQNIYLGSSADWLTSDIAAIEQALQSATRHDALNHVLAQYFDKVAHSCEARESLMLHESKPVLLSEADLQLKLIELYDRKLLAREGLGSTLFNLVLPPKTVLMLAQSSSLQGLGGYHGSLHITRDGRALTLYYAASVFSEVTAAGHSHGVVAFDESWKNVVATLYHQLCEFRTNPDVLDAIHAKDNDYLGWVSRDGEECCDALLVSGGDAFAEVLVPGSRAIPIQVVYSNRVHGAELLDSCETRSPTRAFLDDRSLK